MIFVDNLIYDVDSKVDEVGQSFGIMSFGGFPQRLPVPGWFGG